MDMEWRVSEISAVGAVGEVYEAEPVRRIARRDRQAFDELYRRTSPWLVTRLRRRCADDADLAAAAGGHQIGEPRRRGAPGHRGTRLRGNRLLPVGNRVLRVHAWMDVLLAPIPPVRLAIPAEQRL